MIRYIKLLTAIAVFLISSTFLVYGQEGREAPAAGRDSAATAVPAGKHEGHDPTSFKEKRIVAMIDPDGVQRVEITGGEYYFDPNVIVLKVNVPAELKVKKAKGFIPHDIAVKAPAAGMDFKVDLSDKEAKTVKFTPVTPGKYEMVCDKKVLFFKSHKDRGMDGYIEVVP